MGLDRARLVAGAACAVLALNVVDTVFTLIWIRTGIATEGNPLMAAALAWHPLGFVTAKLALVSLGVYALWLRRERGAAFAGLVGSAVVYAALAAYHLSEAHRLV
jgi:hypothetical protein